VITSFRTVYMLILLNLALYLLEFPLPVLLSTRAVNYWILCHAENLSNGLFNITLKYYILVRQKQALLTYMLARLVEKSLKTDLFGQLFRILRSALTDNVTKHRGITGIQKLSYSVHLYRRLRYRYRFSAPPSRVPRAAGRVRPKM